MSRTKGAQRKHKKTRTLDETNELGFRGTVTSTRASDSKCLCWIVGGSGISKTTSSPFQFPSTKYDLSSITQHYKCQTTSKCMERCSN